jgi:hypothetical protein
MLSDSKLSVVGQGGCDDIQLVPDFDISIEDQDGDKLFVAKMKILGKGTRGLCNMSARYTLKDFDISSTLKKRLLEAGFDPATNYIEPKIVLPQISSGLDWVAEDLKK